MGLFSHEHINLDLLRKRAFNYRWASLEPDVIPLTAADPDFPVAPEISDAISAYAAQRYFSYGSPEGNSEFKEAVVLWYQKRFSVVLDPMNVLPVNSAAHGLYIIADMLAGKGDSMIIPDPVDFLFRKSVEHTGATVCTCKVDKKSGELDLNELQRLITPATKALFICNPNNPLGKRLGFDHLNALIAFAETHGIWIISDEIWADISYNEKVISLLDSRLNTYDKKIVVSGLSKNFALAGLRIGYILTQDNHAFQSVLEKSGHRTTAFGIPVISQIAGAAAFTKGAYWLDDFLTHLSEMKELTEAFIQETSFFEPVVSDSTYLVFPKIKEMNLSSAEMVALIHKEARVALVPGGAEWFEKNSEGHVRICYATSKEILTEAFERILTVDRLLH